MSELSAGQAVKRAYEFLRPFYTEVASLVVSLDRLLDDRGWSPTEKQRISNEGGNKLTSYWALESVTRAYAHPTLSKRLAIVSIEFAPSAFDHAVCLAVAARFALSPNPSEVLWTTWESSDRVLGLLRDHEGRAHVPADILADAFLPAASEAVAWVIPLDELDGPAALAEKIVEPALAALR